MTLAAVYDIKKKKVGDVELPDEVFGIRVNRGLIHRAVCAQLSNMRSGDASTKTRAEVRGGGKKPYRQKGTGRARHGSMRSPIFVGGGAAFGPKARDWHLDMPKKERKAAFKMALSQKNKEGCLFVIDKFASGDGKTAPVAKALKEWKVKSSVIVASEADEKAFRAARNIPNVKVVLDRNLSVLDVVRHENLLLSKDSIGNIVSRTA